MTEFFEGKIKYQILSKLADGGMGSVYEAAQFGVEGFHKRVAIKTLLSKFAEVDRFIDGDAAGDTE